MLIRSAPRREPAALLVGGRMVLISDTLVHEWPEAEDLADIADMATTDGSIIYSPKPVFEPEEIIAILRKAL